MSLWGDWLAVGALGTNEAVYVYHRIGRSWFLNDTLTTSIGVGISYGSHLNVEGGILAVGAPGGTGRVLVYALESGSWNFKQTLVVSDSAAFAQFGDDADIDGNRMVIGARGASTIATNNGAVFVFDFDGVQWIESAKGNSSARASRSRGVSPA